MFNTESGQNGSRLLLPTSQGEGHVMPTRSCGIHGDGSVTPTSRMGLQGVVSVAATEAMSLPESAPKTGTLRRSWIGHVRVALSCPVGRIKGLSLMGTGRYEILRDCGAGVCSGAFARL